MKRERLLWLIVPVVLAVVSSPPAAFGGVTIQNPWIVNDRVADTHNISTMASTYINSYTPNGVVTPTSDELRAINIYNNQKRRLYHWGGEPPSVGGNDINDPTYNQNVFGWCLCGRHASQACTIVKAVGNGLAERKISLPGHWVYEVQYSNSTWHLYDTMTTMYCFTRDVPPHVGSCNELETDSTLLTNAFADGRACPGFLLCGDTTDWYNSALQHWADSGDGAATPQWTGNMNLRSGEAFCRCWESWDNEYPTPSNGDTDGDGYADPPYHHEANKDYKDTVNISYWEPYQLTSAQSTAIHVPMVPTYRRWANGTDTITPDFRSVDYQALLYSSTNIATYYTDGITPDLHANTTGTLAEAVFMVQAPFYLTDGAISGTFKRTNAGDITTICTSPDGSSWTQVWNNTATGSTVLSNLSLRNQVFGNWNQFFVKVQIQAASNKADAGVTGLTFNITFEHNKGAMAYLDKGVNNLSITCANPQDFGSGSRMKVTYKWKEYDGSDWTIDKARVKYVNASPTNLALVTGGTKVPRTEYIKLEIVPTPAADTTAPSTVSNLACGTTTRTTIPLTWTAPGNDGSVGEATGYDLRYSTSSITAGNFSSATQVANIPVPRPSGGAESFTVTGLTVGTTYYFAVKAFDDSGNYAAISNVPSGSTLPPDTQAPNAISNLAASLGTGTGSVNFTWTAPSDNGNGYVATYDLRYSTSTITSGNFSSATQIPGLGTPKSPGQGESFTATLPTGRALYFAIKSADDSSNWSAISNVPSATPMLGTVALQNGLIGYGGEYDSYIYQGAATTNYNSVTRMTICGYGSGSYTRGITQFALSGIPANSQISHAFLFLYAYDQSAYRGNTGYYGAYPLTRSWTDSAVTWNNATSSVSWTTAGGDFNSTADGTAAKQGSANVWYGFDVTSRVQNWLNGGSTNYGWIIKCTDESLHNQDNMYQSGYSTVSLRPKLVVTDGTTTLQAGTNGYTECADNYMAAGATTTNYGTSTKLAVCGYADQGAGNVMRPILRFELSDQIPIGTTINSATLYVYSYDQNGWRGSTGYYGIYPITRAWSETVSTWTTASSGVNWTTAGGDFNATADATAAKQGSAGVWYSFNVTSRVQGWISSPSTNYGWVLKCTDENLHNQDYFTSSQNSDTVHCPKLVITY